MDRQRKFDADQTNHVAAYKYFRELNRHHKFQTVTRLYEKYENDYRFSNGRGHAPEKIKEQYAYAQRNLENNSSVTKKLSEEDYYSA